MAAVRIILLSIFIGCFGKFAHCQSIVVTDKDVAIPDFKQFLKIQEKSNVADFKDQLMIFCQSKGFLDTEILKVDSASKVFTVSLGSRYYWNSLTGSEDLVRLSKNKNLIDPQQLVRWQKKLIEQEENNGYPFANLKFSNLEIEGYQVSGNLVIDKGPYIVYDSLILNDNLNIPKYFLLQYLGVKSGRPYSEQHILELEQRIQEIPFLELTESPSVYFVENYAQISLPLKKKKASSLNGILGILPNDQTGEILITGDAKLSLANSFNLGERIKFQWRKLQTNTQEASISLDFPYLFESPVGLNSTIDLYRRDTTFAQQDFNIGLQYGLERGNYFSFNIQYGGAQIISTKAFENSTQLPPFADVITRGLGIGIHHNKLNYLYNPRKGTVLNATISAGNKRINRNPIFNESAYDGIDLSTNIYRAKVEVEWYIPLATRSTIKLKSTSASILNENLFGNELMRIGGFSLMRGVDEASIFASTYSIETIEYRFLFEENSYFYLFTDAGYWEKNTLSEFSKDLPLSFGTGVSFDTKAGIFSINYALGRQFQNPIRFSTAKVHFGFVSLF